MRTVKILLFVIIGLFFLLPLKKCFSQNNDKNIFSLELFKECGFKDYKKNISIDNYGGIKYKVTDTTGKILRTEAEGILSDSELTDLKQTILNNKFFALGKDLSVEKCYDGSSYDLRIRIDDKYNESGGYCIQNKSFLNIINKLDVLADSLKK